jgi:hypothetical protein
MNRSLSERTNAIHYVVGVFVQPEKHCGPLCVFSSLGEARVACQRFSWGNIALTIFSCLYYPSKAGGVWTNSKYKVGVKELECQNSSWLPRGVTRLATQVKILKEVARYAYGREEV